MSDRKIEHNRSRTSRTCAYCGVRRDVVWDYLDADGRVAGKVKL